MQGGQRFVDTDTDPTAYTTMRWVSRACVLATAVGLALCTGSNAANTNSRRLWDNVTTVLSCFSHPSILPSGEQAAAHRCCCYFATPVASEAAFRRRAGIVTLQRSMTALLLLPPLCSNMTTIRTSKKVCNYLVAGRQHTHTNGIHTPMAVQFQMT